jgi:hypothetical protein
MSRAAKGSGPKCSILLLPRGDQPRARPDLRPTSISTTSSNSACFGVPFAQFWSIFVHFWWILDRLDPSSDPILRVSSLLDFQSDGRRASGTLVVLNTVRAIQVRQGHDATWEHCLSVPRATPEVVLVDFRPLFWPNLPSIFHRVAPAVPSRTIQDGIL